MLKKSAALVALICFGSHIHAAQPRPLAVNANLNFSNMPRIPLDINIPSLPAFQAFPLNVNIPSIPDFPPVPLNLELNVHPHTLVSGLGFAGCLAAIQLYKEGSQLCACQDPDPVLQKAKHDQGNALINRSYLLFAAGAAAIFNKQILGLFIKQG